MRFPIIDCHLGMSLYLNRANNLHSTDAGFLKPGVHNPIVRWWREPGLFMTPFLRRHIRAYIPFCCCIGSLLTGADQCWSDNRDRQKWSRFIRCVCIPVLLFGVRAGRRTQNPETWYQSIGRIICLTGSEPFFFPQISGTGKRLLF